MLENFVDVVFSFDPTLFSYKTIVILSWLEDLKNPVVKGFRFLECQILLPDEIHTTLTLNLLVFDANSY